MMQLTKKDLDLYFVNNFDDLLFSLQKQYNLKEVTIRETLNEVYCYLFQKIGTDIKNLKGIIYQFCYNKHYAFFQQQKTVFCDLDVDSLITDGVEDVMLIFEESDKNRKENTYIAIDEIIENLRLDYKVLYDMYFVQKLSGRKIAKILNTNFNTVYKQIRELKEIVKNKLNENGK